ncbi:MAG: hypothetical protein AAGA90_21775 [Actinomycetota bacterium]
MTERTIHSRLLYVAREIHTHGYDALRGVHDEEGLGVLTEAAADQIAAQAERIAELTAPPFDGPGAAALTSADMYPTWRDAIVALEAEKESHIESAARLQGQLSDHDARIVELDREVRFLRGQREERERAEARVAELEAERDALQVTAEEGAEIIASLRADIEHLTGRLSEQIRRHDERTDERDALREGLDVCKRQRTARFKQLQAALAKLAEVRAEMATVRSGRFAHYEATGHLSRIRRILDGADTPTGEWQSVGVGEVVQHTGTYARIVGSDPDTKEGFEVEVFHKAVVPPLAVGAVVALAVADRRERTIPEDGEG